MLNETNQGYEATFTAIISADDFPALVQRMRADNSFRQLIAENLERVATEYLTAAEGQVAAYDEND